MIRGTRPPPTLPTADGDGDKVALEGQAAAADLARGDFTQLSGEARSATA